MSEDDSFYSSSSSPTSSPSRAPTPLESPTSLQDLGIDNERVAINKSLSHHASDTSSSRLSTLVPDLTDEPAVRESHGGQGQIVIGDITNIPSLPPELSREDNLPVEAPVVGEYASFTEEETPLAPPSVISKSSGGWKNIDQDPETFEKDGRANLAPDLNTEVLLVSKDEARITEVETTRLSKSTQEAISVRSEVVVPHTSPPSTPGHTIHEEDTDTEYEDADAEQPKIGIERPVQKPGNPKFFVIVRLIENTDKRGNNIKSAIRLRRHYFDADFGDFLLDMSGPRTDTAQVRNYAGQERYIPRRMLQNVYQPWDIPAKTRTSENGLPLPLAFLKRDATAEEATGNVAFEEEEAVMIMDKLDGSDDQIVQVTDWERKAGRLSLKHLNRQYERPWGISIDRDALTAAWSKAAAPKLPKVKSAGKGMNRKRKYEDDSTDSDEGKALGKGLMARSLGKMTTGKGIAKKEKEDEMKEAVAIDDFADEAKNANTARRKSTSEPLPKQMKSAVAVMDEEVEPSKVMARKKSSAKTTVRKSSSGKAPPRKKFAGKMPAQKSLAKKTTKGQKALLEAVAEEEESGEDDMY